MTVHVTSSKVINPEEENEVECEENNVIEDVIQLPIKYEVMRDLEVFQSSFAGILLYI